MSYQIGGWSSGSSTIEIPGHSVMPRYKSWLKSRLHTSGHLQHRRKNPNWWNPPPILAGLRYQDFLPSSPQTLGPQGHVGGKKRPDGGTGQGPAMVHWVGGDSPQHTLQHSPGLLQMPQTPDGEGWHVGCGFPNPYGGGCVTGRAHRASERAGNIPAYPQLTEGGFWAWRNYQARGDGRCLPQMWRCRYCCPHQDLPDCWLSDQGHLPWRMQTLPSEYPEGPSWTWPPWLHIDSHFKEHHRGAGIPLQGQSHFQDIPTSNPPLYPRLTWHQLGTLGPVSEYCS